MNTIHKPVMLEEVVRGLHIEPEGIFVDATIGAGGHAEAILQRLGSRGILIGIDWDGDALGFAKERLAKYSKQVKTCRENFANLEAILGGVGVEQVDGVLFDLGISSLQLARAKRGFGFQLDGPLDMRMDSRRKLNAAILVNRTPRQELARLLRRYGEERKAGQIARAIELRRRRKEIRSTKELADLVVEVVGKSPRSRIHPATRTFMALRIAVNDELANLERGLESAVKLLRPGGRLCAISFHSLEDRIVKRAFARGARGCVCPPELPVCACGRKPLLKIVTKRPTLPSADEVAANPRCRSAKMRIAERTEEAY